MPVEDDLDPHEWLALLNRGPLPYTEVTMRGQVRGGAVGAALAPGDEHRALVDERSV
jgi:hypothetical protein